MNSTEDKAASTLPEGQPLSEVTNEALQGTRSNRSQSTAQYDPQSANRPRTNSVPTLDGGSKRRAPQVNYVPRADRGANFDVASITPWEDADVAEEPNEPLTPSTSRGNSVKKEKDSTRKKMTFGLRRPSAASTTKGVEKT